MGRRNEETEDAQVEEQLPLIPDIEPEGAKELARAARYWRKTIADRLPYTNKEVNAKGKLRILTLEAIKTNDIKPDANGRYQFRANGVVITLTPTDEKITVADASESE